MYKALAAYAAALIASKVYWTAAKIVTCPECDAIYVYGLDHTGTPVYTRLAKADQLSILGALALAKDVLGCDSRAYEIVRKRASFYLAANHPATINLVDLDHALCIEVLLHVARS